jgi:hypothetical protein
MFRLVRAIAVTLGIAAVGGCAIHPLPEDMSGASTYDIVRQIRCETRQAIIVTVLDWLTSEQNEKERKVDPASRQIANAFRQGRPMREFNPQLFKGRVGEIIATFFDTGVAYTFDLDITEVNKLNPQINFSNILPFAKLTFGLTGGFERTRQNERTFTVTTSFSSLVHLPEDYCNDPESRRNYVVAADYVYPISGRIGVKKMIQDFIELTLFGGLGGPKEGPPTLTDQLSFTTTISGSTNPTLTFNPGTGLRVTDTSLSASVERTDVHKVTISLAIAGKGIDLLAPLRNDLFTTNLLTASPQTRAERNAAAANNQFLTLKLFQPTVVVPR